jgi:hypothetical protein
VPTRTRCPYKGEAVYWPADVGGERFEDIAWGYPAPIPVIPKIENLISFYNEKVDIVVDGVPQERPRSRWSWRVDTTGTAPAGLPPARYHDVNTPWCPPGGVLAVALDLPGRGPPWWRGKRDYHARRLAAPIADAIGSFAPGARVVAGPTAAFRSAALGAGPGSRPTFGSRRTPGLTAFGRASRWSRVQPAALVGVVGVVAVRR